jgi:hypothetical protein
MLLRRSSSVIPSSAAAAEGDDAAAAAAAAPGDAALRVSVDGRSARAAERPPPPGDETPLGDDAVAAVRFVVSMAASVAPIDEPLPGVVVARIYW